MNKLILSLLLVCSGVAMFSPLYNIKVPESSTIFDYSPDHRFLATATDSVLTIANGHTGSVLQTLTFVQPRSIASLAFSRDNIMLAVGMKNGEVVIHKHVDGSFVETGKTYKSDKVSSVKSICFTSDRVGLVLGVLQDQIVYWHLQSQAAQTVNFGQQFVLSVSCSPTQPGEFVAGGGINTRPKISFYANNGNGTTLIKDLTVTWQDATQAVAYSQNGKNVYIGNEDGSVYICDSTNYNLKNLNIDQVKGLPINKIVVSDNQRIIGLSSLEKVFTVQLNQVSNYTAQQYKSKAGSIALSGEAGYAFIIDENKQPTVLSECSVQQYYDDNTEQCISCTPACQICEKAVDNCYGCSARHFLQNNNCLKCSQGCMQCSNSTTCRACDAHFILFNNVCICEIGYFFKDGACVRCPVGCDICTDDHHCLECKSGFDIQDDVCVCHKGTFLDGQTCKSCIRGCDNCKDSASCLTCSKQQHYVLKDNLCVCDRDYHYVDDGQNCVCESGFYYDQKADYCFSCARGCDICVSFNECTTCKQGLINVNGTCQCKSKQEYLDADGVCKSCSEAIKYCVQCESAKQCTACQADIHRVLVQGSCLCEKGYFPNPEDICEACSIVGCLECQDLQKCKTCNAAQFWQLDIVTSQCKCMKNYSRFENTCIKCGVGCKTCTPDQCLQCQAGGHWILDGGQCICEQAYYVDTSACKKCMTGCLKCSRGDFCDTCDVSKHFEAKAGICTCQQTYYLNSTECFSCSVVPHCLLCVNAQTCIKCVETFTLKTTTSQCYCRDGTYIADNKCVGCPPGCKTCTAANKCTSCQDGYVLKDGVCVQKNHNVILQKVLIILGVMTLATIIFGCLK